MEEMMDQQALVRLLDKEAIREAILTQARGVDRHDDEMVARTYHEGAREDHGHYIGDAAGFIAHARRGHERYFDAHQHYVTNQTIDLDGDAAHAETYYLAALRRKDGGVDLVGGRYLDRLERRGGRWAIAQRACLVEWNGELSPGRADLADLFLQGRRDREDLSYQRPLEVTRPNLDLS